MFETCYCAISYTNGQPTSIQLRFLNDVRPFAIDKKSVYENLQIRDNEHNIISYRLFFDFDGDNALEDCRTLLNLFLKLVDKKFIRLWFSGNRGYHLEVLTWKEMFSNIEPTEIHLHWKSLAIHISEKYNIELDISIFNGGMGRLIRCENSIHHKSDLYKIPLTIDDVLCYNVVEHRYFAKEKRFIQFEYPNNKELETHLRTITRLLSQYKPLVVKNENNPLEVTNDDLELVIETSNYYKFVCPNCGDKTLFYHKDSGSKYASCSHNTCTDKVSILKQEITLKTT